MFYLVLFALELTRGVRGPRVRRRSRVWTAWLAGGLVGAAAASPWLLRVWRYARSFTRLRAVSTGQPLDAVYFSDYLPYLWYLMGPRRNHLILALGVFGLAVVGWRWRGRPLALWTVGLLLIALPWGPQLAPFRPDHAVILFFLPAALFLAGGLVAARDRLAGAGLRALGDALVGGIVFGLLLWGVRETREILNPVTVFAQAGDVHAIEWVADNTPEQARFFINVALWQTGLYRGVDGGWWLLPLAGRETVVPPAVYPMGDQAYVADVNAAAQQAMAFQGCTLELRRFLEEQALEYVYLGPTPGPLSVEEVQDCAYLHPVYDRDGVTIFRFSP